MLLVASSRVRGDQTAVNVAPSSDAGETKSRPQAPTARGWSGRDLVSLLGSYRISEPPLTSQQPRISDPTKISTKHR